MSTPPVRTRRSIGRVVEFGRRDRNGRRYGRLKVVGRADDMFVHEDAVRGPTKGLELDDVVTCIVEEDRQRGVSAREVRHLRDESDLEPISVGARSKDPKIRGAARPIFILRSPVDTLEFPELVDRLRTPRDEEAATDLMTWLRRRDARFGGTEPNAPRPDLEAVRPAVLRLLSDEFAEALPKRAFIERLDRLAPETIETWENAHGRLEPNEIPPALLWDRPELAREHGLAAVRTALQFGTGLGNTDPDRADDLISWAFSHAPVAAEELLRLVPPRPVEELLRAGLVAPARVALLMRDNAESIGEWWGPLTRDEQLYAVAYAVFHDLPLVRNLGDTDDLVVRAVITLVDAPTEPRAAARADDLLKDAVLAATWDDDHTIDTAWLLPTCDVRRAGVRLCEARAWIPRNSPPGTQPKAWCPRLDGVCQSDQAFLMARPQADWLDWSLYELLDTLGVVVDVPGAEPSEWVHKLAGWINRYEEIRGRLRCRTCGVVMKPDYVYAKPYNARYATTVMECAQHAGAVYFSHCRGCGEIIDSRDCPQKVRGFYLCLRCGAGPPELEVGLMCPRCGHGPMEHSGQSLECHDPSCGHVVAGRYIRNPRSTR